MRLPRTPGSANGHDDGLGPEAERELDAIDRALAGDSLEAELAELATLTAELRDQRPEPDEQWRLAMDVRAGEGFGSSPRRRLTRLFRGRRPASVLLPAGALATVAVIVGIGVVGNLQSGNDTADSGNEGETLESLGSGDSGGAALDAPAAEVAPEGGLGALAPGQAPQTEDGAVTITPGDGRTARGESKRLQDRNASLVLETGTKRVREVSDQAIQITESVGGVVISANLTEGDRRAAAVLDLQIPTRDLDATLDRLTDLANVKSLNESSVDITKPFVSAQDRLKDARAERQQLLKALGNTTTEAEADALRAQLKDARKRISRAQAQFDSIARQARLSSVLVEIEGRSSLDGQDGDGWSLGDAARDALDALKTVAGVILIAAAILAPIAILAAIIAAITIAVRRHRRESALDE